MGIFSQGERLLASLPDGSIWVPAVLIAVVAAWALLQQRGRR